MEIAFVHTELQRVSFRTNGSGDRESPSADLGVQGIQHGHDGPLPRQDVRAEAEGCRWEGPPQILLLADFNELPQHLGLLF